MRLLSSIASEVADTNVILLLLAQLMYPLPNIPEADSDRSDLEPPVDQCIPFPAIEDTFGIDGRRLVQHIYWLLAESHLTPRLFESDP